MAEQFYYANEDGTEYRAPKWWLGYVIGGALLVLGCVGPCGGIMAVGFSGQAPKGTSMKAPGKLTVEVSETGNHVIWIDQPDGGSAFGKYPDVPEDFQATVTSPNGSEVPTHEPDEELTSYTMGSSRTGARVFAADFKGAYVVDVKGTFPAKHSVVVTADQSHRDTALGVGALAIILGGGLFCVGGIITLIVTGVRHARAGKSAA